MMGISWPLYDHNLYRHRIRTGRGGTIGDGQEFMGVSTLDLLILGTH